MKIKKGFIIRQLGSEHMVVAIGEASKEFSGMIRLNDTGAFLWNELVKGTTEEEIIKTMLDTYEDLDEATAKTDLADFIKTIEFAIE